MSDLPPSMLITSQLDAAPLNVWCFLSRTQISLPREGEPGGQVSGRGFEGRAGEKAKERRRRSAGDPDARPYRGVIQFLEYAVGVAILRSRVLVRMFVETSFS